MLLAARQRFGVQVPLFLYHKVPPFLGTGTETSLACSLQRKRSESRRKEKQASRFFSEFFPNPTASSLISLPQIHRSSKISTHSPLKVPHIPSASLYISNNSLDNLFSFLLCSLPLQLDKQHVLQPGLGDMSPD